MHGAHSFLEALAIVLCVAGVTTVLFQRLRQPVVLGYILAGMLVGPHLPVPLVADERTIVALSELGLILLMFGIGLEFSMRRLIQLGPTAILTAVVETSIMLWLGGLLGRAFGWDSRVSVFAGAMVAVSSTTIVARAFAERSVAGKVKSLVFGVLIAEDLIAILLLTVLTTVSTGGPVNAKMLAMSGGKLLAFLVGVISLGLLTVPRAVRRVNRLNRPETTVVASIGLCFAIAVLAESLGYSVALGAFLAGMLVAESGEAKHVEHLTAPVRDLFAAIFFVSVGMQIDPAAIATHWGAVLAFTGLVIVGKILGVSLGAFFSGNGTRLSVQAGMSLAQIGEFSFIIAGLAASVNARARFLYPIAVAVSAITTLGTPWLIRLGAPAAAFVDRKLPGPLQTFATLYGSWIEQLRSRRSTPGTAATIRRLIKLLLGDVALTCALIIGTSIWLNEIVRFASVKLGLAADLTRVLAISGAVLLAVPLAVGIFRLARALGLTLAKAALPSGEDGKVDLAAAPRRALVVTLQLAIILVASLPIGALTQPFLPRGALIVVVLGILVVLAVSFWRSATHLQGHVKAGAEVIVEALASGASGEGDAEAEAAMASVRELMHGIGEPIPVRLHPDSPAVGKSLAELKLRGITGASVLAIARGGEKGVISPSAEERLRAGDVLALAGSQDSLDAARALLAPSAAEATPGPDLPAPNVP
jgi:CPA2 family monovalent cation:H+ antiporter-2